MEAARLHAAPWCVPHDHPALPGHFPGNPVVPGVLVLEAVLEAAQRWLGEALAVRALPQVKFNGILRPGAQARIELELRGAQLRFQVSCNGERLAQGLLVLACAA